VSAASGDNKKKTIIEYEIMAIGMISVRVGKKGKAVAHANYISKEQKFAKDADQVVYKSFGNMPNWIGEGESADPKLFWEMADLHERKNGSAYREHILALPRELSADQRVTLLKDWIQQEIGEKYPYQVVIHNKRALDGGEQPHAHLMFCERVNDHLPRPAPQFFKRYNASKPSQGGCKKDNSGIPPAERKTLLKQQRERWGTLVNQHLLENSFESVVDMRNWKEKGLDKKPENYSMQQMNDVEFKAAYSELVTTKRELAALAPVPVREEIQPRNTYPRPW
jgi:hypothetical protein